MWDCAPLRAFQNPLAAPQWCRPSLMHLPLRTRGCGVISVHSGAPYAGPSWDLWLRNTSGCFPQWRRHPHQPPAPAVLVCSPAPTGPVCPECGLSPGLQRNSCAYRGSSVGTTTAPWDLWSCLKIAQSITVLNVCSLLIFFVSFSCFPALPGLG